MNGANAKEVSKAWLEIYWIQNFAELSTTQDMLHFLLTTVNNFYCPILTLFQVEGALSAFWYIKKRFLYHYRRRLPNQSYWKTSESHWYMISASMLIYHLHQVSVLLLVISMFWKKFKSTLDAINISNFRKTVKVMVLKKVQNPLESSFTELNMFIIRRNAN